MPCLLLAMVGCASPALQTLGRISMLDPACASVVDADARIERLAQGFTWAEGPAWIGGVDGALLFTDVPENRLHRWSPRDGLSLFLHPSGYAGAPTDVLREPGANGLLVEPGGSVLLADSGSRLVARLDLASKRKTVLAERFDGRRFNSPNDLARRADGTIFFTDPPYGLAGIQDSPARELSFSGVYRLDVDGTVHLLDDSLAFPNGIALSPDNRTLYVSNSDPARPVWIAYALDADGAVRSRRVLADATDLVASGARGLPDGMAVAADGTLFASAPGGVLVFTPDGRRLGRIETGGPVSNVTFGGDGHDLYMTSGSVLARVRVRASARPPAD
ncbi:MAG TPA: SMP-30/gluconolactonase/LRE family protein [Thermomonas sp.]|nr:SMP-30/gluconolactonase/LRE family protein [Thermomonas sp.]